MIRNQQIDKLSDLFLDLSKGTFLAAFGIQFFTPLNSVVFLKLIILGLLLVFFSLKVLELKQDGKNNVGHTK
jgi:hypothetical protein